MKRITKVNEYQNNQYTTSFEVDCGMFQVDAEVYSTEYQIEDLKDTLFSSEISDMDLEFKMDGKRCNYEGFKELYEKLYGKDSFIDFNQDITKYVETEHFRLSGRPYLQNISVDKAKEYLSELLTTSTYATGYTTLFDKQIVYTDKWNIIELAKIAYHNLVHSLKCKRTNCSSDREYQHSIFDLDAYWSGKR